MNASNLFAGLLFGLIGMAAFGYGKKQGKASPMLLGAALMIYPYFLSAPWAVWAAGAALTAALFVFRD